MPQFEVVVNQRGHLILCLILSAILMSNRKTKLRRMLNYKHSFIPGYVLDCVFYTQFEILQRRIT